MMRKNIIWIVVVVGAALVQTTVLEYARLMGVLPDLAVLLVVYYALTGGIERAMLTGAIAGLFLDVASNAVIGHHVLCLTIVGYIAGRIGTRLVTDIPAVKVGIVFLIGVLNGLLYVGVEYVQEPEFRAVYDIIALVVPTAFYSALVTPFLFFVLDRFEPSDKPKKRRPIRADAQTRKTI